MVVPKQSVRARAVPYINKNTGKPAAFIQTYQTKVIKDFEKYIKYRAMEQLPKDFKKFEGSIAVSIWIKFPVLKSMSKKIIDMINTGTTIYKTTSPDLTDNLLKGIFDGLQKVIYDKDQQISLIRHAEKIYAPTASFTIKLEEIEQVQINLFNTDGSI